MLKILSRKSLPIAVMAGFVTALAANVLLDAPPVRADVTLVEKGVAKAVIVLPEKPFPDEARAAKDIQYYVHRISAATLEVVSQGSTLSNKTPILIGRAAPDALAREIAKTSKDATALALFVDNNQVALRGLMAEGQQPVAVDFTTLSKQMDATLYSEKVYTGGIDPQFGPVPFGTRNAAQELLEQLGVRWYFPGELGTVVPQQATIVLKSQKTVQVPSFPARGIGVRSADWKGRLRQGGLIFPAAHGMPGLHPKESKEIFKEHPEYFALVNGVRKANQLCVSNPAVVKIAIQATKEFFRKNPEEVIIGAGANDGRSFCECDKCKALDGGDYDPFGPAESVTDRYVWFFNQILDGIKDEFPDKRIGFYAYSIYNRPPVKWKPNPRIVPAVALITLCRVHGIGNPICPEKEYQRTIVEGWGKLVPEVFDRGYWFNLADPGLPFFMIKRVADEVPLGQKLGIRGWRVESLDNYSGGAPSLYLASRLQWNVDTDVNALMADFYDKFFGPAAKPMQAYIETMDDAVYNGDYHSGSSWEAPEIFNEAIRSKARAALKSAGALVKPDSLYGRRVEMYDKNFRYLEAFVAMLEKRANHDYAGAMKALGEIDVLRDDLSNHPFPLISRKAKEYMERFFRAATVQGYERTTGGNELVAPLVNDWEFKIDPEKVGSVDDLTGKIDAKYLINRDKTARFFNKATDAGGGWQKVAPYTTTWSDLGLRHFKGKAWYRQTVDVPAKFKDKRIFLWFGGVDEKVVVWVNNVQIGSGSGSFRPFELDATNAVTPGKNTVVVQAINEQLNELGTGGIVAPVMFYAPVKGAEAVPQGSIGKGDESIEIIAE